MNKKTTLGLKVISHNRKAHFNYSFKEMYEAGIVLSGSEVKSLRAGKISIAESYAYDYQGEIFLINSIVLTCNCIISFPVLLKLIKLTGQISGSFLYLSNNRYNNSNVTSTVSTFDSILFCL